ncbi:pilus assembly protein TadG-related protein [Vreelandella zhuhanensis]|nr:pilus assembly protein TadG-related protein [Halomonas zhuhanensis]
MKTYNHNVRNNRLGGSKHQRGVSTVLVAVSLLVLLGFAALAIDVGNLYVARNELHNAADAGSLAGARFLYCEDGSSVNDGTCVEAISSADQIATTAAQANQSQNSTVEVISARRGHWSFTTREFTASSLTTPPDLTQSTADLDLDLNFINAVEVVSARQQTPVETFFARVLGIDDVDVMARSVAYIGFAGALRPEDVDQPIAMCRQALLDGDSYSCDVGRFIPEGDQTGGWTNFEHDDSGATNANDLKELICGDGNPNELRFGEDIATNNGQVQAAFQALYDCWVEETDKERLWSLTLPVVDCEEGIAPSNPLVGAVNLNIAWIVDQSNKIDDDAPLQMELPPEDSDGISPGTWSNADPDGVTRWDDFVETMNLRDSDDSLAYWASEPQESGWRQKTIYFLPSCSYHEPKGQTGGENFGILAQIPVLVD